jgi:hypothetical protein
LREQGHHAAEFPIAGSERRMAGPATLAAAHTAAGSLRGPGEALRDRGLRAVTHGRARICSAAGSHCCPACPGAASSRSGSVHPLPMAGSRGPGLARHGARVRDPRPGAGSPAVTAACQRGEQAWPRPPVRPALCRGRRPPDRGRYGLVRAAGRPCGAAGWPVVTEGGFPRGNPPRRYRVVTLAGRAHQPAQSVRRPARGGRPSPVVRLPERGRIHESGLAPGHGAAGGGNPDLVADDTVPGDRHRVNQRIEPHLRLPVVMITVSQDPDGRRLSYPASLPDRARPPGVPGETS